MRKIAMLWMAMVMCFTIPITVRADNAKIIVSDTSAERTQMVYVNVSLEDCDKANTLGISIEYDSNVLKKVASDCTWTKKGVLQDFDVAKDNGVWATDKASDLNGEICTLAFRVKANAPIGDTEVSCTVIVKKDSKVIGTYTAKGTVSVTCEHSYGEWSQKDENTHSKICKLCQYEKTASHKWDVGVVTKQPTKNEEGRMLYTCEICGGRKQVAIPANGDTGSSETESSAQTPTEEDGKQNSNGSKPTVPAGETSAFDEKPTAPARETTAANEKLNGSASETATANEKPSGSTSETAAANEKSRGSAGESMNSDEKRPGDSEAAPAEESSEASSQSVMESKESGSGEAEAQESHSDESQQAEALEQEASDTGNSTYYLVGGVAAAAAGAGILMIKRTKGKK